MAKHFKKTGDPKIDFPELFSDEIDNVDQKLNLEEQEAEIGLQNNYVHRSFIEELKDNAELTEKGIYDRRVKRTLFQRIVKALFKNDSV